MRNFLVIFISLIFIFGCTMAEDQPSSGDTTKTVYVNDTGAVVYDGTLMFTQVTPENQELFNDWVYVNNNNDTWIELDLDAIIGNDSHECICIIRIASVEGVEDLGGGVIGVTEYMHGQIRKPDPLLVPYNFSCYMDVQEYEQILIADDNGKLQIKFNFGWPFEKRQRVIVKCPLYAKTK